MAEKPKEFLIEKLERSISPTAKTWQLSEGAPKTFLPKKAFEEPMKRLPVEVKPPVEAEPKKPSTFWKTVGDIAIGALQAYAMGPGEYLRLVHGKIEAEKQRKFQKELAEWNAKLRQRYEAKDTKQMLNLIRQRRSELISFYNRISKAKEGRSEATKKWARTQEDKLMGFEITEKPGGWFGKAKVEVAPLTPSVIPTGRTPTEEREFSKMSLEELEAERQKELSGR